MLIPEDLEADSSSYQNKLMYFVYLKKPFKSSYWNNQKELF